MNLVLSSEEVQSLVTVLGELPTKSNAYPLLVKIVEQHNEQAEPVVQEAVVEEDVEAEAA